MIKPVPIIKMIAEVMIIIKVGFEIIVELIFNLPRVYWKNNDRSPYEGERSVRVPWNLTAVQIGLNASD